MPTKLQDRVVVITGASSGIGRATALLLAERGATVVAAARREAPLRTLVDECSSRGADALSVPTDVSDADAVDALAREAVQTFGRIDAWVNNAAVGLFSRLEDAPAEDIRRVIDTNILGYLFGARAALPWMREQGSGVIVNVGSVLSSVPGPYLSSYVVSKAASLALSGALRTELRDVPGIKVGTVLPGAIDTPFFEHAGNYTGRQIVPLHPTYGAERVARAVVSCLRFPRREVHVGLVPRAAVLGYRTSKAITERVLARTVDRDHFTDDPAAPTAGNLHVPMAAGAQSTGGWQHGGLAKAVSAGTAAAGAAAAVAVLARRSRAA